MKTPLSEKIKPMFLSPQNLWMIDEVKKLEKQNEMMYITLKKLMEMRHECFIPNEGDWWDNMAQEAITLVEGEGK
jgi:hypothetical protein